MLGDPSNFDTAELDMLFDTKEKEIFKANRLKMYKFSKTSKLHYATLDPKLQQILDKAIQYYDFSIICGHRNKEGQEKAFKEGKSKKCWPESKHNQNPSIAVDIAPWNNGIDWNNIEEFYYMAGIIMAIAERHFIKLRWGGHWKTLKDCPHFELL